MKLLTRKAPNPTKAEFANAVDPDETAHNEPSHLDLQCLPSSLSFFNIQSNLHKRDTFLKGRTVCYTQVSVLSRFSQKFCHEEIFHSVIFMIKLQYIEDQAVCLTLFYMIPCFITPGQEKIPMSTLVVSQVCAYFIGFYC